MTNAFVNIDKDVVKPNAPYTYSDREYAKNLADLMKDTLFSAIDDMRGVLENYKPAVLNIDTSIPDTSGPNYPSTPVLANQALDNSWPKNYPGPPILLSYGNLDFSYVAPIAPDEINSNFGWEEDLYASQLYEALFDKALYNVINGGTGLSDIVYTAIVNQEQEARRINQDRTYRLALDSAGETGFNLGSGILGALQAETLREFAKLDQDSQNALRVKNFDLATENTKFFVNAGVDIEKILRAAYEASQDRSLESAKFAKDLTIQVYSELTRAFVAKWEGIKVELEAHLGKIEGTTAYNTGLVDIYEGQLKAIETQVNAISAKNQSILDADSSKIDIYKANVSAISDQWRTIIAKSNLDLEGIKLEVQLQVEQAKINLDAYTGGAELSKAITDSIAKIAAQAMASALGIIHTSLSSSYSGSEALGENWGHSENLSESHSYSEE